MPLNHFDPLHNDIKRHASSGFIFSALAQGTKLLTQFLSVIIMARILKPADFGLVAEVAPLYAFASMFHDLGLSQATIQKPNLTGDQVNAFFWINSGAGLLIAVCLCVCSPVVGWFYHDPRTVSLTIAMALLIGVGGFSNQHGALMQRRMAFRDQAIINMSGAVAGLMVSVLWGMLFNNYWALYAGMAVGTLLPALGVWISVKWRPGYPRLAAEMKEMLRYGMGIAGGNFLGFIVNNVSGVVIGRVLGGEPLGFYDRAARLLSSPLQQLIFPISGVVVPILYRLENDADKYRRTFLRTVGTISLTVLPGILWVIVASDIAVATLLGRKWQEAAPVFSILSFAALPQFINSAANWLILTQGRSKDYARWSLVSGIFSLIGLFAGLSFGILGIAIASAVVQILRTPLYWRVACRTGPVRAKQVVLTLVPHLAGGATAVPVLIALRYAWASSYPLALLIVGTCASYAVVLTVVMMFPAGREAIKRDIGFAKFMLRQALKS